jgi:hypothetical protein
MLEAAAPRTCDAIWEALPLVGPLWHTKTAGNEVYTLLPGIAAPLPVENGSLIPLPGDLLFFAYPPGVFPPTDPRWIDVGEAAYLACIGSFYERNSIHWMELGFVPGTRWARIVEGLEAWQAACQDVWLNGCEGEQLELRRASR